MKLYDKLVITGCDDKTEWMLKWFLDGYIKHNPDIPIIVVDFGMSEAGRDSAGSCKLIDLSRSKGKGWGLKPRAMLEASKISNSVIWVDTDCEIHNSIEPIFNLIEDNKLAMVEDKPWTMRRREKWHNSGVVGFRGKPDILDRWATGCAFNDGIGDQEVLHSIVRRDMNRLIHISDLPNKYNVLRLQALDKTEPQVVVVSHHTGPKGKEIIRRKMIDG